MLPARGELEKIAPWEKGLEEVTLMEKWLEIVHANPFDFNKGLYDEDLKGNITPEFHKLEGSNFFRGLALIDLAEAMLKRAFGKDAVAIRINAAGQGDYFQVHINKHIANTDDVKEFINKAFYKRFGLNPDPSFVSVFPGGGASGVRLERFGNLSLLINRLKSIQFAKNIK
jgi:hypothetical protein